MKIPNRKVARLALGAVLASATVATGAYAAQSRTTIPFADIGNIRDWQASSPDELYVQAMNRTWYRATFWAPCQALPFATGVAFVTESNGSLDTFSSILVEGERCWFKTFDKVEAPPPSQR